MSNTLFIYDSDRRITIGQAVVDRPLQNRSSSKVIHAKQLAILMAAP